MGQKVSPVGLRVGINRNWDSRWYANDQDFAGLLHEDIKIREFIKEMNNRGTTFILTTHDLEDVEQLAQRVIIINHGQKVFDDTLHNLQLNLGNKKIIHLTSTNRIKDFNIDGVKVIEQLSDYEITLEANVENSSINDFIRRLNESYEFSDISIKELPMDKIITQIYESKEWKMQSTITINS